MEPFIESNVLKDLTKGSNEELAANREQLVSEHFGGESLAVSNHASHGVFLHGDEAFRADFSRKKGVEALKSVTHLPGAVVSESTLSGYVGEGLSAAVESLLSGGSVDSNRLHGLALLVQEGESYWFSDHAKILAESVESRSLWADAYEENREDVRKSLRGSLSKLESLVPKTRYGRIATGKLTEFDSELRESFGIMLGVVGGIVERIQGLQFEAVEEDEYSLTDVASSLLDEARLVLESGRAAAGLVKAEGLPVFANIHDSVSDMVREMVIVGEYLSQSTEINR